MRSETRSYALCGMGPGTKETMIIAGGKDDSGELSSMPLSFFHFRMRKGAERKHQTYEVLLERMHSEAS